MHNRNKNIDVYKGIGIIFVLITHFGWTDYHRRILLFPFWIDMAVPMFMIISGYVYAISNNKISSLGEYYSIKNVSSKVVRYTVPFVIMYSTEIILNTIGGASQGGRWSFIDICKHLLCGGVGSGSYYYPIMIQFVFVFPVIYLVVKKKELAGVASCFIVNLVYELLQWAYDMSEASYRLLVFRYIFVISFGCYLANRRQVMKKWQNILCFIIGTLFILMCSYFEYRPIIITHWEGTSLIACLYIIPISTYLVNLKKNISCGILELIGKAAYNIFLVQMVYFAFFDTLVHNFVSGYMAVKLFASLFVNIAIGIVFYYLETPLTKYLKNQLMVFITKNQN